jgi:transposase
MRLSGNNWTDVGFTSTAVSGSALKAEAVPIPGSKAVHSQRGSLCTGPLEGSACGRCRCVLLSARKASAVLEWIKETGVEVLYLPPYSPDLNRIENSWARLKQLLRAAGARTNESLDQGIANTLLSIFRERGQIGISELQSGLFFWVSGHRCQNTTLCSYQTWMAMTLAGPAV